MPVMAEPTRTISYFFDRVTARCPDCGVRHSTTVRTRDAAGNYAVRCPACAEKRRKWRLRTYQRKQRQRGK